MVSSLALQIYFSVVAINQATNYKTFFSPHLPVSMVFHPHLTWPFLQEFTWRYCSSFGHKNLVSGIIEMIIVMGTSHVDGEKLRAPHDGGNE